MRRMTKYWFLVSILIFIINLYSLPIVNAYNVELGQEVHQYLTNESKGIWKLIPKEIKEHLGNTLQTYNDNNTYENGELTIDGSAEEDFGTNPLRHFWQPDNPKNGKYNDGLTIILDSSWERAKRYWEFKVIPNYLKGNVNESYYWLGRVAHLLEDVAQPSHVHLDAHGGPGLGGSSILEDYTGSNFSRLRTTSNWQGKNFNLIFTEVNSNVV